MCMLKDKGTLWYIIQSISMKSVNLVYTDPFTSYKIRIDNMRYFCMLWDYLCLWGPKCLEDYMGTTINKFTFS